VGGVKPANPELPGNEVGGLQEVMTGSAGPSPPWGEDCEEAQVGDPLEVE